MMTITFYTIAAIFLFFSGYAACLLYVDRLERRDRDDSDHEMINREVP